MRNDNGLEINDNSILYGRISVKVDRVIQMNSDSRNFFVLIKLLLDARSPGEKHTQITTV
jgi:hypothetical protein